MTYNVFSGTLNPTHFTSLQTEKLCRVVKNLKTVDNASKFKPVPFLQRHRQRVTVVSRDDGLFLST